MALNLRAVGAKRVLLFGIACMMFSSILQGCGGGMDGETLADENAEPEPKDPEPTAEPAPAGKKRMTEEEAQAFIMDVQESCEQTCDSQCQGVGAFTSCGKCLKEKCNKEFHDKCEEQGYDMDSSECEGGNSGYALEAVKYVVDCAKTGLSLRVPEYVQCCIGYIGVGLKLLTPCLTEGGEGGEGGSEGGPRYR